jgi:uncharacterized membrane protein
MTTAATASGTRIGSLDAWRGLIIVVMALDHANGFIARGKLAPEMFAGPYPDYGGDWPLFLTRWVTHLAAPGFFFLLGAGAVLFANSRSGSGWSRRRIGAHLAVRGGLLIALQFTVENGAWRHGESLGDVTYVGVLFALGGALIVASVSLRAPAIALTVAGVATLVFVEITIPSSYAPAPVWRLLAVQPGFSDGWFSLYPIVPWLGVAWLGMAYGAWLDRDRSQATGATLPLGIAALAAFAMLRAADGFGNLREAQTDDLIGFLNTVKYPPATTFVSMALGIGFLAAWAFSRRWARSTAPVRVLAAYGTVPLFFYLTHLWLYAQMGLWIDRDGTGPAVMYFWWLAGLTALYPACWAYGRFKRSRPAGSIWRFL